MIPALGRQRSPARGGHRRAGGAGPPPPWRASALSHASADRVRQELHEAVDSHAVLLFRDQMITDEQQMAFSRNFGAMEEARGGNITRPEDRRLQVGMNDVSNLGRDGQPLDPTSRQRLFNLGNMLWHSDSSLRVVPPSIRCYRRAR